MPTAQPYLPVPLLCSRTPSLCGSGAHRRSEPLSQSFYLDRVATALLVSVLTWAWCPTTAHARQPHGQPTAQQYTRSIASYEPPNVPLVDMTDAAVPLGPELSHRGLVLLQFIFTTCSTICPVMSGVFAAVQDQFGSELAPVHLLSITIAPEYDTPERLQEYARQFKAGQHWRFLTGKRADLVAVQKAFDAYRGNKMRHEPTTYLRASPDAPWVRLDGMMSAAELLAECRRLMTQ